MSAREESIIDSQVIVQDDSTANKHSQKDGFVESLTRDQLHHMQGQKETKRIQKQISNDETYPELYDNIESGGLHIDSHELHTDSRTWIESIHNV